MREWVLAGRFDGFDHTKALSFLRQRMFSPFQRYAPYALGAAPILGFVVFDLLRNRLDVSVPRWTILIWIALCIVAYWYVCIAPNRRVWSSINAAPIRQGEMTFSLSDDGLQMEGPLYSGIFRWAAFVDVVDTEQGLLVLIGPLEYLAIPNSVFGSDAEKADVLAEIGAHITATR